VAMVCWLVEQCSTVTKVVVSFIGHLGAPAQPVDPVRSTWSTTEQQAHFPAFTIAKLAVPATRYVQLEQAFHVVLTGLTNSATPGDVNW
jgi:hypothetical protein